MAQYALPAADDAGVASGWIQGAGDGDGVMWNELDEGFGAGRGTGTGPDDATSFWVSPSVTINMSVVLGSLTDPASSTGHIIRGRIAKTTTAGVPSDSGQQQDAIVRLLRPGSDNTIIGTSAQTTQTSAWTTLAYTLTGTETDTIVTGYYTTGLRLEVRKIVVGGGSARAVSVSTLELECPNAAGGTATYDQDSFRFRNDDGSQTGASWVAALNTNASLNVDTNYRLRLLIQNTGTAAGVDVTLTWQYNLASAGWNAITTSSSVVRAVTSANFAEGDDCTQQLGSGTFYSNNDGMTEDGTAGGANLDLTNGQECETELSFQIRSADVTDGQTIQFRISGLDTYTQTPLATVVEAGAPVGPSRGSLMMTGAGR